MKQDESEVCCWTLGRALSTIPDSGAPGSAEFGSEAAFGMHATLFREIQAALLQFKQWLKDSRSWMSSYWTTKRRQQEEEKNQSSTQSLSSPHNQSAHPVAKGRMQKWFSHSFEQILGNKVSLIPVPSKAGLQSAFISCFSVKEAAEDKKNEFSWNQIQHLVETNVLKKKNQCSQ